MGRPPGAHDTIVVCSSARKVEAGAAALPLLFVRHRRLGKYRLPRVVYPRPVPTDSLTELARVIAHGLPGPNGGLRPYIDALFGDRYQKRYHAATAVRDAYALADGDEGVPYSGIINPDNPPSGPYGGTSVVWFPSRESGSLIDFGIGTRGLAPDEGILTRPGHKRRVTALRRHLARMGIETWVKHDPSALGTSVPKTARDKYPGFEHVFKRYGAELYACAVVPREPEKARAVVQAFLDLYAYERGWLVMKAYEHEYDTFHETLRGDIFAAPTTDDVHHLLRSRRFVVLQGPPGTGKTRMADEIRRQFFGGRGLTVQFHPAVTYEDFVVGLSPDAKERTLRFDVRPGWLVEAARAAKEAPTAPIWGGSSERPSTSSSLPRWAESGRVGCASRTRSTARPSCRCRATCTCSRP